MQNKLFVFLVFLSVFSFSQEKIIVGPGPEDIVLDTFLRQERILISCDPRRDDKPYTKHGDIWDFDIKTNKTGVLVRKNEPDDLSFNPHGIHLLFENQKPYLFVVNHFRKGKKRQSEIIRYQVVNDTLIFERRFPYTSTINSVYALSKDHFIITNDKKFNGNLAEFKQNQFVKIDKHIKYPNGLNVKDSILYLSTTMSNKIYAYPILADGTYGKPKKIAKIKGLDNIRMYENTLLTTSHPKLMRVVKHFKNKDKISPSVVYQIDLSTNESKPLYKDDGAEMSAASVALIYKDYLYISQIFEPFMIRIKMP